MKFLESTVKSGIIIISRWVSILLFISKSDELYMIIKKEEKGERRRGQHPFTFMINETLTSLFKM